MWHRTVAITLSFILPTYGAVGLHCALSRSVIGNVTFYLHILIGHICLLQTAVLASFDEFLLAQTNGDVRAVEILHPLRLRYFSPEELLRLFCFENVGSGSTFRWPEGVDENQVQINRK
jgi:hypothetical protein